VIGFADCNPENVSVKLGHYASNNGRSHRPSGLLSPRPEVESGISAPKTAYGSKPPSNYGNNRIWVGFRDGISWAATCLEGEAMLD